MKTTNKYTPLKSMPIFEQFMINEVFKLVDVYNSTLKERLEMSYRIIKNQPKIYDKMKEKGFFTTFLTINKCLAFDCKNMQILIDTSYKVLHDKEDVKSDYKEIKNEISKNNQMIKERLKKEIAHTFTQARKIF